MSAGRAQATLNAMSSFAGKRLPAKARAGRWAWRFLSAGGSPLGSRPGRPALLCHPCRLQPSGLFARTESWACLPAWHSLACGQGEEP
jgi:hypothetical protein